MRACSCLFVCNSLPVVVHAHLLRRKIVGVLYARGMRVKQLLRVRACRMMFGTEFLISHVGVAVQWRIVSEDR